MQVIYDPWPHSIIDSYYPHELFDCMKSEIVTYLKQNMVNTKQTLYRSTDPTFIEIFPHTHECALSVSPYSMFKYFDHHRQYEKLSHYVEVNVILDGYDYPIHDENPRKILSIVNYVAPEQATGTLIYTVDKQFVKEVEWKQNRALIFPGITDVTWHAYRVEPKKPRITLNTFLVNDLA